MKKDNRTVESSPVVPVLFLIVLLFLAPFVGGKDNIYGTATLCGIAIIAGLAFIWCRQIERPVGFWPFAVFIGLLAASSLVTASLHATIQQTFYFAACAIAAMAASSIVRNKSILAAALLGIVGAGLVLGAMGVTEYIQQYRVNGPGWRVFGPFFNPGVFGGYLVLALPVTLAVFLTGRSPAVVLGAALAVGFETATIFFTGTRFAAVSAALAIVVFFALTLYTRSIKKRHIGKIAVVIIILSVAVGLANRKSAPMMDRIQGKAAVQQTHSGGFRVATWKGTLNVIKANPLLGTGAGTFQLVFPRYMVAGYTGNAHNSYLQIASEAGIPAFLTAATAFFTLFIAGIRGLKRDDESESALILPGSVPILTCGIIAALVGGLARNLPDSDMHNPAIGFTFWILAGVLASRFPVRKIISLKISTKLAATAVMATMLLVWSLFTLGQHYNDAGSKAAKEGSFLAAIDCYRSATAVDPLCGNHWFRLGPIVAMTAQDEDEWNEGLGYMRRAIRLEPTRARNVITLGRILAIRGDTKGAVREFKRALELDPHATLAMVLAAEILETSDKTRNEAEKLYKLLLEQETSPIETLRGVPEIINPDYAEAHYYFAEKAMQEKRWSEAEKHLQAIVDRLELRKKNKLYNEAAEVVGNSDPERNAAFDELLETAKVELRRIRGL